jgi:hypothetical protein
MPMHVLYSALLEDAGKTSPADRCRRDTCSVYPAEPQHKLASLHHPSHKATLVGSPKERCNCSRCVHKTGGGPSLTASKGPPTPPLPNGSPLAASARSDVFHMDTKTMKSIRSVCRSCHCRVHSKSPRAAAAANCRSRGHACGQGPAGSGARCPPVCRSGAPASTTARPAAAAAARPAPPPR